MPSSGSITSPLPDTRNVDFVSATISRCFQVPQRAVLAPFLREFDRCLRQIPLMFLELSFKALEKGKRVRGRSGKARQNLVAEQPARLSRRVFHHVFAHGDLSIGGDHNFIVAAHAQNRGAVNLFGILPQWHPIDYTATGGCDQRGVQN